MSEKREWVLKAFRGEKVDHVPVGFWHHFTSEDEWLDGFSNPAIIEKNIQGHKRFIREVQPDFIKLMSDGYFAYPNPAKELSENLPAHMKKYIVENDIKFYTINATKLGQEIGSYFPHFLL